VAGKELEISWRVAARLLDLEHVFGTVVHRWRPDRPTVHRPVSRPWAAVGGET